MAADDHRVRLRAPHPAHVRRRTLREFDPARDYYATLGVVPAATRREIDAAYRKLAARYHPDRHQGNELEDLAREKLAEINEAHRVLKDDRLRASYDTARRGGATGWNGAGRAPSGTPSGGTPAARPGKWSGLIVLVLLLAALPLLLRLIRSPNALLVIGLAIAAAWFGPRIWRLLKKGKR
ncbi:MAG: DnaJ domain-containing protein [Polyangia bacterium]